MNNRPRLVLANDPPEVLEKRRKATEKMRVWRAKHPENRVYQKTWAEKNKAKKSNNHYVRKYGLSLDAVRALLEAQGGVCAICGAELAIEQRGRSHQGTVPNVDHDHSTGSVRGILCHFCNAGLGYFRDRRVNLTAAANYLKNHERK